MHRRLGNLTVPDRLCPGCHRLLHNQQRRVAPVDCEACRDGPSVRKSALAASLRMHLTVPRGGSATLEPYSAAGATAVLKTCAPSLRPRRWSRACRETFCTHLDCCPAGSFVRPPSPKRMLKCFALVFSCTPRRRAGVLILSASTFEDAAAMVLPCPSVAHRSRLDTRMSSSPSTHSTRSPAAAVSSALTWEHEPVA